MIWALPPVTTKLVRPTVDRLVLAWFSVIVPVRLTVPPVCTMLPRLLALKASPRLSTPPETAMPLPTVAVLVHEPTPEMVSRCTAPALTLMLPVFARLPRYQFLPAAFAFSVPWKLIASSE